ncbi:MAG: hypothetical protein GEV11_25430 [Streptosporangiales bacterium]|nr:hypothetical protein [Streptosporangiales bacterium]
MADLTYVAEVHHQHRDVTGGWLRPAVFGVMDGLVSNAALLAGVVGSGAAPATVVVAGLAGLAAGAFSMATGEYTSVASQRELTQAEIATERREITENPEAEERELALVYEARGLTEDLPSPWVAAGSSFLAFALGALIPVLPFLFGLTSILAPIAVTGLALFGTGALVARLTTRSPLFGGVRQLALGAAAATVTYGIGALVGTAVS